MALKQYNRQNDSVGSVVVVVVEMTFFQPIPNGAHRSSAFHIILYRSSACAAWRRTRNLFVTVSFAPPHFLPLQALLFSPLFPRAVPFALNSLFPHAGATRAIYIRLPLSLCPDPYSLLQTPALPP